MLTFSIKRNTCKLCTLLFTFLYEKYVIATRLSTLGRQPAFSEARQVLDSMRQRGILSKSHKEIGPAVVEMTSNDVKEIIVSHGKELIITPVVRYDIAVAPSFPSHIRKLNSTSPTNGREPTTFGKRVRIRLRDSYGNPLADATLAAYFNYRLGWGITTTTDTNGLAILDIPKDPEPPNIEVVYIYPAHTYWNLRRIGLPLVDQEIVLSNLPFVNGYQWWAQATNAPTAHSRGNTGAGIKVAVIDTGIGPHGDLTNIVDGENFTDDGGRNDYRDIDGHGTHVAGIVGANGTLRGIAPDTEIYAARVFSRNIEGAEIGDIAAAIETAVSDWNCDIINLSLGGPYNELLEDRINYATYNGVLCVVAAGNSGGVVEYPGALKNSYSVTAIGRLNEYPNDSIHKEAEPASRGLYGKDMLYAADFSCRGPEVCVCAPGVSIISTLPANTYGALDGTSMAAPVVTGIAALVLQQDAQIRSYAGTIDRVNYLRSKIDTLVDDIRIPKIVQGRGLVTV